MGLEARIATDLTAAMKARDSTRVSVLRMLKSRLIEATVARRSKSGPDATLTDADVSGVIAAYAKQRRDAIEAYKAGKREDLVAQETQELEIVLGYLPAQLGDEELRELVAAAIRDTGASGAKEMGVVMKALLPKVQGRADGKRVSALVRDALA